jgi:hypothetical protein
MPGDEIVLRVRVLAGDSFRGFVGHSHDDARLSFNGWIDFMGAVSTLLVRPDDERTEAHVRS